MNTSSQLCGMQHGFNLVYIFIDNYDIQIHMAWLLTCLISLYTYRIQPPLQSLHIGHLHSKHVTATSLIVFDFVSSCTVEFDVEIRNHFWIWSKYTWEDAPPVATLFLHLARVHSAVAQRDTLLFYHLRALKKTSNLATSGSISPWHRTLLQYNSGFFSENIWGVYVNCTLKRIPVISSQSISVESWGKQISVNINEYQASPSSPILFWKVSHWVNKNTVIFDQKTKVIPSWSASVARFRGELDYMFLTPSQWMR